MNNFEPIDEHIPRTDFVNKVDPSGEYHKALLGEHHQVKDHSRLTPDEKVRLSVHLLLRDVLSPVPHSFADDVDRMEPRQIVDVEQSFKYSPLLQVYPNSLNDAQMRRMERTYSADELDHLKKTLTEYYANLRDNTLTPEQDEYWSQLKKKYPFGDYYASLMTTKRGPKTRSHDIPPPADDIKRMEADLLTHYIINAGQKFDSISDKNPLKNVEQYYWAPIECNIDNQSTITKYLVAPVGDYGEDFAKLLVDTGRTLVTLSKQFTTDLTKKIQDEHSELIFYETARGKGHFENAVLANLQEGIESVMHSISFFTQQKIEGYENPVDLVRELIKRKLPNQFALKAAPAFLAPSRLNGSYYQDSLVQDTRGNLTINDGLIRYMEEQKASQKKHFESYPVGVTHEGCPVARRRPSDSESGVERISDVFLKVMETLQGA